MYNSAQQGTPLMPSTSSQNLACQDCLSKVPGLDYVVPPNQSVMLRNYTPPEFPTVVYVPQRQCQQQYNNLIIPQYQCADQPMAPSRFSTTTVAGTSNIRSSTPVYGRNLVAQQDPQSIAGCGCNGAQGIATNQQILSSNMNSNNQIPLQPGTYNYPSKKPCCYPENGTTNNPKYLQEVEGQEFLSHFPNKKYNRKKVNLEAVKEQRPRMTNKWVTEHRENFGFFSCSAPVNEAFSSNDSMSAQSQQQLYISPTIGQPQMNPPGVTPIYNPDYYQQGMPITPVPTPAAAGNEDYQDVFEASEDAASAQPTVTRPKSPSHKKKQPAKKEQPKKEVTKPEPPQMNDTLDRRSRGPYSEDNGPTNKEKKKTKQEMYAEVFNRTISKIQQKETNQKKKMIDRQDQFYNRLAVEEKQTLDRNQRELQSYMNRGDKPPFYPYGNSNVTPVSDKNYMNTFNVAPRDPSQIVKDVVARREKTAEYDGWKKLLDEQDFKPWKPKSFYWKSFDRFDKYNNEQKRDRNSYGLGNNDMDDKMESIQPTPTTTKKRSSRPRKEEKKTAFVEPIADSSDEEKENIRQYNEQNNQNTDMQQMKARNSDYYSPEEYQMMIASQQQPQSYPINYSTQAYQGNYSNNVQYAYTDQVQANAGSMAGQPSMINCESKRPNYEGPLVSDLKGLQFSKFIPKDYSDFNPKNYKALPIHYLNYIRPAGKVTPSNDAISECFRFYD